MNRAEKNSGAALKKFFPVSWRDTGITAGILALAVGVCAALRLVDQSDVYVALIFVLVVVLVSRFTDGYLYGLLASLGGVVCVNYIFTYPYFAFNFTISGYPLTFLVMLAVSIVVSTLTAGYKQQERVRAEAEKEKMRGNLLRAVSHDIRTPLTSIVGGVNAILENGDRLPDETRKSLLENIRDESQWLVGVVENLLSVTRISDSTSGIRKELEAGEEVLSAAVVKFRKRFPDLDVHVSAPDELLMVPMDAILIEQVLINLMENSALHGVTTSRIDLRLRREENMAVFEVADDGRGISREALGHLFDGCMTHVGDEPESDQRRNMGIGLSVCMTIVQAHGGTMTARNQPSGGALVAFTLPLEEKPHENSR
jgi:two-component system sensor histidine kinase KdpD